MTVINLKSIQQTDGENSLLNFINTFQFNISEDDKIRLNETLRERMRREPKFMDRWWKEAAYNSGYSDEHKLNEEGYLRQQLLQVSKAKIAVVYNAFSLDAMMAAAVLHTAWPGCTVIDSRKRIYFEDFETIHWLGISPRKITKQTKTTFWGRKHTVTEDSVLGDKHIIHEISKDNQYDSLSIPTLFDKVCRMVELDKRYPEEIHDVGYAISHFDNPKLSKSRLVILWLNMINAEKCLSTDHKRTHSCKVRSVCFPRETKKRIFSNEFFGYTPVNKFTTQDIQDWEKYLLLIKQKVNNNFNTQYSQIRGGVVKTTITSMTDDHYWAMRILKMSQPNVVNLGFGHGGIIIDGGKDLGRVDKLDNQFNHQSSLIY
jgi:hypothetical protein